MATTVQFAIQLLVEGQSSAEFTANEALQVLDALAQLGVKDRDLATPPGSPAEGDRYLIATSPTGAWSGHAGKIAVFLNGAWTILTPREGWSTWVDDENIRLSYDGSAWSEGTPSSWATGITASTTQTQGQQPLTKRNNRVDTVANANDVVTLEAAAAGGEQTVANFGANTLQIFPASGDSIDLGGANASTTLASGKTATFKASDATKWASIKSA